MTPEATLPGQWANPPFYSTFRTNVAREFLTIIDQCFPPGNPLRKIFNRNTVKVAYSTTPNMNTSLVWVKQYKSETIKH